jgi:hypothetical protein
MINESSLENMVMQYAIERVMTILEPKMNWSVVSSLDGSVIVNLDGQRFEVNWQPMTQQELWDMVIPMCNKIKPMVDDSIRYIKRRKHDKI